ncbi:TAP-like protein-domain-containing protein [Coniochaeta sp. 2T2.1]|nr:TAP-like protein-domain-containing protein [Coniochaeta sp. 2T2.1]
MRFTPVFFVAVALASNIQWQPCAEPDFRNSTFSCASLPVPLDYTVEDSETIDLQLLKVSAKTNTNRSIILNFGGPGEPDRANLAQLASYLLVATGGSHDLITFDTRGTYNTLPFSCYGNDTLARAVAAATTPTFGRASNTALGAQWAGGKLFAETCYARNNLTGSMIGTAFIARDVMRIVDALGEDGLRYWGFSYGTLLGATIAAMFPDRMDRVVLDGVVNPFEYYHGYDIEKYTDTDKVFSGFVSSCVAANCALAKNQSAAELEKSLYDFLEHLKFNPVVLASTVIDYSLASSAILSLLYSPGAWPSLATGIHGVMTGNATEVSDLTAVLGARSNPLLNEYLAGIQCSDKAPRASELSDILPFVDDLYQKSRFSDIQTQVFSWCANWKFSAKERYAGDFQVKTRSPILLIGNTYDPVTPLVSALNVSHGFQGSVVLEHGGYGTSMAQPSACTIAHIQSFFDNATLPTPSSVCEPSVPLFGSSLSDVGEG